MEPSADIVRKTKHKSTQAKNMSSQERNQVEENTIANCKLSILVPVFNEERFLRETLTSLVSQTLNNIEIIVGDNASTDNSWYIILEMARRNANILCIRRKRNIGAVANVADLIKRCTSQYIAFIGGHDV
jgi:glycosyltransferase involved in cell wall biosynthesis